MKLVAAAVLASLAALPAQAQGWSADPEFTPLPVGAAWTYRVAGTGMPHPVVTFRVRPDTVVGGTAYRLLEALHRDADGGPVVARSVSAFRDCPGAPAPCTPVLRFDDVPDAYDVPLNLVWTSPPALGDTTVWVNGAAQVRARRHAVSYLELGAMSSDFHEDRRVAGLGAFRRERHVVQFARTTERWVATLVRAEVNGLRYDAAVTTGAEPTVRPAAAALRLGPNPAREMVRVAVPGAPGAAVAVEVVDVLGRRRLAAAGRGGDALVLDVRALADGLYTVRAGGASAVLRVVR